MKKKYVYLLEHHKAQQPVNVGIFTSLAKAKSFLKSLPKKYQYKVYKLPLNTKLTKGRNLEDQRGIFDHWHYGTSNIELWELDHQGNIINHGIDTELTWPD